MTLIVSSIALSCGEIAVMQSINRLGAPTIIFLHDSLGCIDLWRDFPERLGDQTHANILVFDRQGYGRSCPFSYSKRDNSYMEQEADLLIELIDHFELHEVILFGHSDGGSIALIAAGKYPEKVKMVIAEGAHIFVEDITLKGINEAIDLYKNTDLNSRLKKYHGEKTDDMFWAWAKTWTEDQFSTWNIEHFLAPIKCPVLVVQGEADEYGSLKQVEGIVKGVGGYAETLIVERAKHSPHKESAEEVLKGAVSFIKEKL
ncbi:MAG: alpha/beta hydrolase [Imperialibacter sp.]|uniref:alpha/beta fold hydrolase n=1 Tax=Imperialibacter sp. TaxID=2038411 RepID=UPI0032EC91B9